MRLVVGLVGMVQGDLQLVDLALELLLDPECLGLGALLGLETRLQGVHGAGVVLAAKYVSLASDWSILPDGHDIDQSQGS